LKFDPADRLREAAKKILAEQPAPPRSVSMFALLRAATSPVVALAFVPLLAIWASGGMAGHLSALVVGVGLVVMTAALSLFKAFEARGPLVQGIVAQGEILTFERPTRTGIRGRLRVDGLGRRFEADYGWTLPERPRPGDHVEVLIDPDRDRVLWCLGLSPGRA
jgi:hypothetical protein